MKKMMITNAVMFATATTAFADIYVTSTGAGNEGGSSWENVYAGIRVAINFGSIC